MEDIEIMLVEGSELVFHRDVTLVLAADRDQRFHWRRGTALSHSSSAKRGTRERMRKSELPHSTKHFKRKTRSNRGCDLRTNLRTLLCWDICIPFTLQSNHERREATQTQKSSSFYHINITTPLRVQNSGYIQKLCPLGEAHSIVSSLQLWVLSQLTAHHGHLLIHVHEKPIFCVLQEERHEKSEAWQTNLKKKTSTVHEGEALRDEVTVLLADQSKKSDRIVLVCYEY